MSTVLDFDCGPISKPVVAIQLVECKDWTLFKLIKPGGLKISLWFIYINLMLGWSPYLQLDAEFSWAWQYRQQQWWPIDLRLEVCSVWGTNSRKLCPCLVGPNHWSSWPIDKIFPEKAIYLAFSNGCWSLWFFFLVEKDFDWKKTLVLFSGIFWQSLYGCGACELWEMLILVRPSGISWPILFGAMELQSTSSHQ